MWFQHKKGCLVMALVVGLQLAACTPEQSQVHLIKDPKGLQKILQRCEKLPATRQKQDPICIQAFYAAQQLRQLSAALMADQQRFGQQIINEQIMLTQRNDALKQTRSEDKRQALQDQIDRLREHIEVMQAITVLAGE